MERHLNQKYKKNFFMEAQYQATERALQSVKPYLRYLNQQNLGHCLVPIGGYLENMYTGRPRVKDLDFIGNFAATECEPMLEEFEQRLYDSMNTESNKNYSWITQGEVNQTRRLCTSDLMCVVDIAGQSETPITRENLITLDGITIPMISWLKANTEYAIQKTTERYNDYEKKRQSEFSPEKLERIHRGLEKYNAKRKKFEARKARLSQLKFQQ